MSFKFTLAGCSIVPRLSPHPDEKFWGGPGNEAKLAIREPNCTKISLTFHMWPAAIVLKYVKNITQQIIIIYEKSQFNSLVWSSPMVVLITYP